MIFRVFLGFAALLCAYLIYDTAQVVYAKRVAQMAPEYYVLDEKNADIIVVEFLDYSCPACQAMHPILMRALERDGRVRFVPRPIPSPNNESATMAAKLVYAAGEQGKFYEAHNRLIENFRVVDDAYIENFIATLELDPQKVKDALSDPQLDKALQDNSNILSMLKGTAVPALLINGKLLFQARSRAPSSDDLLSLFNRARAL